MPFHDTTIYTVIDTSICIDIDIQMCIVELLKLSYIATAHMAVVWHSAGKMKIVQNDPPRTCCTYSHKPPPALCLVHYCGLLLLLQFSHNDQGLLNEVCMHILLPLSPDFYYWCKSACCVSENKLPNTYLSLPLLLSLSICPRSAYQGDLFE